MKRILIGLAAAGLLTTSTASVYAEAADDWPNRPVRVISTFAAGGTADILARVAADILSETFKQQFYVEVRAGAGGQIGVRALMETPPDGYNFAVTNISHLVLHPMTRKDVTYDPHRDLTNIAFVGGSPVVLSVNPKSGFKSLKDFVTAAREKPLAFSSSGLGSMGHLVAENFIRMAKLQSNHVPYKGASQALGDLVGGHIVWSSQTVSSTASFMRGGTLTGLAVSTEKRLPDWPDLPTFAEQGYPDLVASIWFSISGPAKLPDSIVKRVAAAIENGFKRPKIAERMRKDGLIWEPMGPDRLRKFVDSEHKVWTPVVEQAGLMVRKPK